MAAAVSFFSLSLPQALPSLFAEKQTVLVFWGVFRCCLPRCPCALWLVGCARGWHAARWLCVCPAAGGTSWPCRAAGRRCTQTEITSLYIDYVLSYRSARRLFLTDRWLGTSALLLAARAPWAAARCPYQLPACRHPGKQREWGKKAQFPSLSLQNTHRAAPVSPTHSRHGVQVVGGSRCPCSRAHVPSPCLPGEQGGGKHMGL